MESVEYQTVAWTNDAARMLKQLNELGAQGWEVCGHAATRADNEIPWLTARHEVLLLKRRNEA